MSSSEKLIRQLHLIESQLQNLDSLSQSMEGDILRKLQGIEKILAPKEQSPSEQLSFGTEEIEIFCDGSALGNPGPGGWGAILRQGNEERELSGSSSQSTNNIMEMTAALEALRQTPENAKVTLTTDSQYLVKGMTQWIAGWKRKGWKKADGKPVLNQEIWEQLDLIASLRQINWKWVKGHAGHEENERCDQLAREAAKNQF